MADEFLESEVVFSDEHYRRTPCAAEDRGFCNGEDYWEEQQQRNSRSVRCGNSMKSHRSNKKTVASSLPVTIPESMFRCPDSGDEAEDDEVMVPPHEIVGRRIAGKMAFSVCTGNGRTLKGRDLSQVRNSILRMTGFLEA